MVCQLRDSIHATVQRTVLGKTYSGVAVNSFGAFENSCGLFLMGYYLDFFFFLYMTLSTIFGHLADRKKPTTDKIPLLFHTIRLILNLSRARCN